MATIPLLVISITIIRIKRIIIILSSDIPIHDNNQSVDHNNNNAYGN